MLVRILHLSKISTATCVQVVSSLPLELQSYKSSRLLDISLVTLVSLLVQTGELVRIYKGHNHADCGEYPRKVMVTACLINLFVSMSYR